MAIEKREKHRKMEQRTNALILKKQIKLAVEKEHEANCHAKDRNEQAVRDKVIYLEKALDKANQAQI